MMKRLLLVITAILVLIPVVASAAVEWHPADSDDGQRRALILVYNDLNTRVLVIMINTPEDVILAYQAGPAIFGPTGYISIYVDSPPTDTPDFKEDAQETTTSRLWCFPYTLPLKQKLFVENELLPAWEALVHIRATMVHSEWTRFSLVGLTANYREAMNYVKGRS